MRRPNHSPGSRRARVTLACAALICSILVPAAALGAMGGAARVPIPKIMSFTPMSGKIGTRVTISGANLHGLINGSVRFGNAVALKYAVKSSTTVWAIVPRGARSGKISIHIPANAAAENGPIHPAEVATFATLFTVT